MVLSFMLIFRITNRYSGIDDEFLTSEPVDLSVELLPLLSEVLCDSFSGIRIVHYNIQGLLSKTTDVGVMCKLS